jgi:hypothetical protein
MESWNYQKTIFDRLDALWAFDTPAVEEILRKPTVSFGVTCAVAYTYGCDDGRIGPTRCAIIAAVPVDR